MGETQVWSSTNGGASWIDTGLAGVNLYAVTADSFGNFYAGTSNGVYQFTLIGWVHLGLTSLTITTLAAHPNQAGSTPVPVMVCEFPIMLDKPGRTGRWNWSVLRSGRSLLTRPIQAGCSSARLHRVCCECRIRNDCHCTTPSRICVSTLLRWVGDISHVQRLPAEILPA